MVVSLTRLCREFLSHGKTMRPPKHRRTKSAPPPRRRTPSGAAPTKAAPRPINQPANGDAGERLQKVLAQAGIASRRECEELIREGRVEVDRKVVTELGTRVDLLQQEVRVDGEALGRPKPIYFAVNKPTGVVCTARDPAGRTRVTDLLPPDTPRTFCVGRLDMETEGLILVTNDGELANGLTHPRHGVEKIYQVQVAGHVEQEIISKLQRGVHLAEGFAKVKHVRIKSPRKQSTILEMVLDEGRNREVRRLLARVGHKVQRLKRVAVGPVRLGELPAGAVRPLTKLEIQALQKAVANGDKAQEKNSATRRPPAKKTEKSHRDHRGTREKRTVIGG
jgi:23S rRNA pseudouridine2605 synthase